MLLDIGFGFVAALAVSAFRHSEVTLVFLLTGACFALFPDLDALWSTANMRTKHAHEHRCILHRPLIVVPIGAVLLYLLSPAISALFILATLLHCLHDSVGLGWGIQWLYPFDDHYYGFLYQWDLSQHGIARKNVYAWTPAEAGRLADDFGSDDWISQIYGRLHPYAIVEFIFFSTACLIAILVILKR